MATIDPTGHPTTTEYDPAGNATATVDALGNRTTCAYDAANRRQSVTDPAGDVTTSQYDAAGNVTAVIDARGKETDSTYDGLNRRVGVKDPDGNRTTSAYDPAGNLRSITDPNGHTTTFSYDPANRRVATTDPLGHTTTTAYDNDDNVTAVTDPDGKVAIFSYDTDGLRTAATDPLGHTATYAYDTDNRLTSTTDRLGRRRDFTYDSDGRELTETWYDSGGSAVNFLTFTYDADGHQTSASASNSLGTPYSYAVTFSYDDGGRLQAQQEPFGLTLTYGYDDLGRRTQVEDSLDGTVQSAYDPAGRLTSRSFFDGANAASFSLAYSPRGELTTLTRAADAAGNQVVGTASYTYDDAGRLTALWHLDGSGQALASYAYAYDATGLVQAEQDDGGAVVSYAYDAANELTGAGPVTYGYDAAGNRTTGGFVPGPADQLQTDGTWTYTYDAEGNLTKKSKGPNAETWTYGYDNVNHLAWAEDRQRDGGPLLQRVDYRYDALGDLRERSVTPGVGPAQLTRFAYDGDNAWADLDSSNNLQVRRVYGDGVDQPVLRLAYPGGGAPATVAWYLADRQGTVRDLADGGGALQDHRDYDAFGNPTAESDPAFGDRYGYTGRERDAATGLQFNRARWYDPAAGRWQSRDPAGFASGDANPYRYVHDDPTGASDPTGLWDWSGWVAAQLPNAAVGYLGSHDSDWIKTASDYSAGIGDTVSGGLTAKVRQGLGYDDVVDYQSDAYRYGAYSGQAINIGLMAVSPTGWAQVAVRGINLMSMASGVIDAGQQALQGDFSGVALTALNLGVSQLRGAGGPCGKAVEWAERGLHAFSIAQGADGALQKFRQGDYVGAVLDAAQAGVSSYRFLQSCFAAGTPLLTPTGHKPIEAFRAGDLVLSRDERDPSAEVEAKRVEEVFVRTGRVLHLHVGGQVIRTTAAHPFFAYNRGWVAAGALRAGDRLSSHDGGWVAVEDLLDTGEHETVYNLRVADFHTYFVGSREWGFSVWAHNAQYNNSEEALENLASKERVSNMLEEVDTHLAASQKLNRRTGEPEGFRTHSTIGLSEVETNQGRQIWVAGAGEESMVPPRIRTLLESPEINPQGLPVRHVADPVLDSTLLHINDAEMHIARTALSEGATVRALGATRDTCQFCQIRLAEDFNIGPEQIVTSPAQNTHGFSAWPGRPL